MAVSDEELVKLREGCARVLGLTPRVAELLADRRLVESLEARYAAARFVRIEDIVPSQPFAAVATALASILEPVLVEVTVRHETGADGTLSYGSQFRRVDPGCLPDSASRGKLETLFDRLGVTAFGAELGAKLSPLICRIVGNVTYRRVYLYVYEDGDYISAHDDHHVGERVDVQFPVTVDGVGGIRVLSDGLFRMHYDTPGCMNILGPSMWHEVPPLLRLPPGATPRRVNVGLRFTPD